MELFEDEDDDKKELRLQVLAKIRAMYAIFVDLTTEEIENIQYVLDGSDDKLFDVEGDTIPGLQALGAVTVTAAQANEGDTKIHGDVPSTMVETSAADNELGRHDADGDVISEVHRSRPTTPTAARVDEGDNEAHCYVPSTMVEMPNHTDEGALSRIHGHDR